MSETATYVPALGRSCSARLSANIDGLESVATVISAPLARDGSPACCQAAAFLGTARTRHAPVEELPPLLDSGLFLSATLEPNRTLGHLLRVEERVACCSASGRSHRVDIRLELGGVGPALIELLGGVGEEEDELFLIAPERRRDNLEPVLALLAFQIAHHQPVNLHPARAAAPRDNRHAVVNASDPGRRTKALSPNDTRQRVGERQRCLPAGLRFCQPRSSTASEQNAPPAEPCARSPATSTPPPQSPRMAERWPSTVRAVLAN